MNLTYRDLCEEGKVIHSFAVCECKHMNNFTKKSRNLDAKLILVYILNFDVERRFEV